jgi:ADP-heptose:LPS heptosyltransferase
MLPGGLLRDVRAMRRRLRAERLDLPVNLQGLAKSGLPTWLNRAPAQIVADPQEVGDGP